MAPIATVPIPVPMDPTPVGADGVFSGPPIPPVERIRLYSSAEWEAFVQEWVNSLNTQYTLVEKCAGSGDMGRDVIAMARDSEDLWDNYQCKHYNHPLMPTDIWSELGKLVYYTAIGEYTYPRRYFFVGPQGAGTTLSRLLHKPDNLRAGLIDAWEKHVRTKITVTAAIELNAPLREYLDRLDFSIFEAIPPLRIVDGHNKTRWHVARFGGGLPSRPEAPLPPPQVAPTETNYVRQLFDAYQEHLESPVGSESDLGHHPMIKEHFGDARREFYSAESLRAFSRDTLPPGEFDRLQDDVESGIRDDVRASHADGYERVLAVVKTARVLQLNGHALIGRITVRDRGGICHQLANDDRVRWVK